MNWTWALTSHSPQQSTDGWALPGTALDLPKPNFPAPTNPWKSGLHRVYNDTSMLEMRSVNGVMFGGTDISGYKCSSDQRVMFGRVSWEAGSSSSGWMEYSGGCGSLEAGANST